MAVTAKFVADFSSFTDAVNKAEVELKGFETQAGRVEKSLNKMVDNFSGRKLIQDATLMAKSIEEIGGTSMLTEKQLKQAGATAAEALELMQKRGLPVPPLLQQIAKEGGAIPSTFQKIKNALGPVGTAMLTAFSTTAIIAAGKRVLDFASNLEDMSQKTGISTTGLQKLQLAFEQSGIGLDAVSQAAVKLSKNLIGGDKATVDAFQKLGLSVKDLKQLAPEDLFFKVADAVGRVPNQTEKAFAAMTVFGKGGAELLAGLTGNLEETTKGFEAMGLIIDEKTVKAADDFGDQLGLMGKQLLAITAQIVGPLLPGLSALGQAFSYVAGIVGTVLGGAIKVAQTAIGFFLFGLAELLSTLTAAATKIPVVGKQLSFLGDVSNFLKGYAIETAKAVDNLWASTDKTAEKAQKATPALLGFGKATEDAGKKTQETTKALEASALGFKKYVEAALPLVGLLPDLSDRSGAFRADLDNLTESVHEFNNGLFTVDETVSDLVTGALTKMPPAIAKTNEAMEDFRKEMDKTTQTFSGGFKDILSGKGFGQLTGAIKDAINPTKALSTALGNLISGGISSLLGLAAKGIGSLFSKLFGGDKEAKQVRELRQQFIDAAGGLAELQRQADIAGVSLAKLLNTKKVDDFKAAAQALTDAFAFQDSALQTAKETAEKYGITLEQMGPQFRQGQLNEQLLQLFQDQKVLTAAGVDFDLVLQKQQESFQDLILVALKTGATIPEQLKPAIERLIEMGLVTDESGEKLTDISRLTFAETLEKKFTTLIDTINKLADAISRGLGGAISQIPRDVTVGVHFQVDDTPKLPERFHKGGLIPFVPKAHSGLAVDEALILAQKGEGIVSRRGMQTLGVSGLNALNGGAVPSGGGMVLDFESLRTEVLALRQDMARDRLDAPMRQARAIRDELQKMRR